jgi:hypothetical protein
MSAIVKDSTVESDLCNMAKINSSNFSFNVISALEDPFKMNELI